MLLYFRYVYAPGYYSKWGKHAKVTESVLTADYRWFALDRSLSRKLKKEAPLIASEVPKKLSDSNCWNIRLWKVPFPLYRLRTRTVIILLDELARRCSRCI